MIRGIGASLRGMATEQAKTDTLGNNISNLNTDGYKRQTVTTQEFGAMVVQLLDPQAKNIPVIGQMSAGAAIRTMETDNSVGPIQETGNPLDVALRGTGEFTFQGPGGLPGYTRSGAFVRDSQGRLVTAQGYPLLVGGQPVGAGAAEISLEADGTVMLDGKAAGRLDIRGGDGQPLVLKSLERSNVDLATELTEMMVALRSYQANSRALTMQDNTLNRAVNEIGKV